MDASILLNRVEKPRSNGPGRWLAKCPAHEDSSPSLSIAEAEDRILVHCFAGCSTDDVCEAAGLSVSDLFSDARAQARHASGLTASERLALLEHEATVILVITEAFNESGKFNVGERERLRTAVSRIYALKR